MGQKKKSGPTIPSHPIPSHPSVNIKNCGRVKWPIKICDFEIQKMKIGEDIKNKETQMGPHRGALRQLPPRGIKLFSVGERNFQKLKKKIFKGDP